MANRTPTLESLRRAGFTGSAPPSTSTHHFICPYSYATIVNLTSATPHATNMMDSSTPATTTVHHHLTGPVTAYHHGTLPTSTSDFPNTVENHAPHPPSASTSLGVGAVREPIMEDIGVGFGFTPSSEAASRWYRTYNLNTPTIATSTMNVPFQPTSSLLRQHPNLNGVGDLNIRTPFAYSSNPATEVTARRVIFDEIHPWSTEWDMSVNRLEGLSNSAAALSSTPATLHAAPTRLSTAATLLTPHPSATRANTTSVPSNTFDIYDRGEYTIPMTATPIWPRVLTHIPVGMQPSPTVFRDAFQETLTSLARIGEQHSISSGELHSMHRSNPMTNSRSSQPAQIQHLVTSSQGSNRMRVVDTNPSTSHSSLLSGNLRNLQYHPSDNTLSSTHQSNVGNTLPSTESTDHSNSLLTSSLPSSATTTPATITTQSAQHPSRTTNSNRKKRRSIPSSTKCKKARINETTTTAPPSSSDSTTKPSSLKSPASPPNTKSTTPTPEEVTKCCICLEEPKLSDMAKINSCPHIYCYSCIEKWAERENTCPQCKLRFRKIERIHKSREKPNTKRILNRDQRSDYHQFHSLLTNLEGIENFPLPPIAQSLFYGLSSISGINFLEPAPASGQSRRPRIFPADTRRLVTFNLPVSSDVRPTTASTTAPGFSHLQQHSVPNASESHPSFLSIPRSSVPSSNTPQRNVTSSSSAPSENIRGGTVAAPSMQSSENVARIPSGLPDLESLEASMNHNHEIAGRGEEASRRSALTDFLINISGERFAELRNHGSIGHSIPSSNHSSTSTLHTQHAPTQQSQRNMSANAFMSSLEGIDLSSAMESPSAALLGGSNMSFRNSLPAQFSSFPYFDGLSAAMGAQLGDDYLPLLNQYHRQQQQLQQQQHQQQAIHWSHALNRNPLDAGSSVDIPVEAQDVEEGYDEDYVDDDDLESEGN